MKWLKKLFCRHEWKGCTYGLECTKCGKVKQCWGSDDWFMGISMAVIATATIIALIGIVINIYLGG